MKTEIRNVRVAAELLKQVMAEFDKSFNNYKLDQAQGQISTEQMNQDKNKLKNMMDVMSFLQAEIKGQLEYLRLHPDKSKIYTNFISNEEKKIKDRLSAVDNRRNEFSTDANAILLLPAADKQHNIELIITMLNKIEGWVFENPAHQVEWLNMVQSFMSSSNADLELVRKSTSKEWSILISNTEKNLDLSQKNQITSFAKKAEGLINGLEAYENLIIIDKLSTSKSPEWLKQLETSLAVIKRQEVRLITAALQDLESGKLPPHVSSFEQLKMLDYFVAKAEQLRMLEQPNVVEQIKRINGNLIKRAADDFNLTRKSHFASLEVQTVPEDILKFKVNKNLIGFLGESYSSLSIKLTEFIVTANNRSEGLLRLEQAIIITYQLLQSGNIDAFHAAMGGLTHASIDRLKVGDSLSVEAKKMLVEMASVANPGGNYKVMRSLIAEITARGMPSIPSVFIYSKDFGAYGENLKAPDPDVLAREKGELQALEKSLASHQAELAAHSGKDRDTLQAKIEGEVKRIKELKDSIDYLPNQAKKIRSMVNEINTIRERSAKELSSVPKSIQLIDLTNLSTDDQLYAHANLLRPPKPEVGGEQKDSSKLTIIDALGGLAKQPEVSTNKAPIPPTGPLIEPIENTNAPSIVTSEEPLSSIVDAPKQKTTSESVIVQTNASSQPEKHRHKHRKEKHKQKQKLNEAPQEPEIKINVNSTAPLAEVPPPINLSQANQSEILEPIAHVQANLSTRQVIKPERSELLHDLSNRFNELHINIMDKRDATPERLANIEEARQIINEIKKIMHELNDNQYKKLENEVRSAAEKSIQTFQATVSNMVVTLKMELAQKLHELAQIRFVGIDNDGKRKEQLENARAQVVKINSDIDNILKLDVDNPHVKHYIDDYRKLMAEYDKFLIRNQTRELTRYDEAKIIFKSMMDKAIEMNNILIDIVQTPTPEISEKARRAKELLSEIKRDKSKLPNVLQGASEVVVKISDLNLNRINEIQVPQFTATSKEPVWQAMPSAQDISSLNNLASASAQAAPAVLSTPSIAAQDIDLRGSNADGFYQPMPPIGDNSSARSTSSPEQTAPSVVKSPSTVVQNVDLRGSNADGFYQPMPSVDDNVSRPSPAVATQTPSGGKASDNPIKSITEVPPTTSKELPNVTAAKPPVGNVSRLNKFFGDLFHFNVVPKKDSNQIMGAMLGGKVQEPKSVGLPQAEDRGAHTISAKLKEKARDRPLSQIEIKAEMGRERREQEALRMQKGKGHAPK